MHWRDLGASGLRKPRSSFKLQEGRSLVNSGESECVNELRGK
jgi:hypothetical protein